MMLQTHLHQTALSVQTSWSALTPGLEKTAFLLVLEIGKVGQWKSSPFSKFLLFWWIIDCGTLLCSG